MVTDWRGTPIEVGSHVMYHTLASKTVEGTVVAIGEPGLWGHRNITIAPEQESGWKINHGPYAVPRGGRHMDIDWSKVTVMV